MRAGSGASNSGSTHTLPVNHSADPSCPTGLSRDNAGTAEAVAEEDADAWLSTRFISMHFYRLRKGRWQRRLLTRERATIQQKLSLIAGQELARLLPVDHGDVIISFAGRGPMILS